MDHQLRRLTADDAEDFRAIRLESLERHPEAFAASYEIEGQLAIKEIARRLTKSAIFGGFVGTELMGVAGFAPLKSPKAKHKGILWGMYLREAARGSGLAQALAQIVLEYARSQVEQVQLSVVSDNAQALSFYKSLGFESYGVEPRALKIGDDYFDEELLIHYLK